MKICISCGCQIVNMHRSDVDCLKELSVEIPRLKSRLKGLEDAQRRMTDAADSINDFREAAKRVVDEIIEERRS